METLSEWLSNPSPNLIFMVPTLAFLEACAGIGIFVSGIFLLSLASLLYTSATVELPIIVGLAFAGAMLGDQTGYLLGRLAGHRFWDHRLLAKYQGRKDRIHALLEKSAPLAVIGGRLTPALRSITPIVAGISGLPPAKFIAYDALACTIWATGLYLLVTGIAQL